VKADETGLGKLLPKTGPDSFFRYPAPKIVKCRISESSKKIILRQNIRPFFAREFGKRYSANVSGIQLTGYLLGNWL
jgi:hypothetical protein